MNKQEARKKLEKLQNEVKILQDIIDKPIDLFTIKKYSEVCIELCIIEKTRCDFDSLQEYRYHQIKNIEKLFNRDWVKDFMNMNQYKYYPYFRMTGSGLVFCSSYFDYCGCDGQVSYFKDKKTSDYIGNTFLDIYKDLI